MFIPLSVSVIYDKIWTKTGCHQNRTSVSQLIETSVYFWLVWCKSSDMILSTLGLAQAYCAKTFPTSVIYVRF